VKSVSAREANQHFSRLLSEVAAGEEVVITRRGRPVATLSRYRRPMTSERGAAIERLMARLNKGVRLGGVKVNREEIYNP